MTTEVAHRINQLKSHKIDDSLLKEKGIVVKDLMLYVTQRCNLRCKHCYVGNEWLESGESFEKEDAEAIIDHFASRGLDRLTFLGGEPVLHPNITDFILKAKMYDIKEKRMTTNATTLGFLDFDRLNASNLDHVSVSVDGVTANIHDKIRGAGTFARTIKNIKELIEHGFAIHITFTINGLNKDQAAKSAKFFKELGAKEVNFHLVSMIGNAAYNPKLFVSPHEWIKIRKQIENTKDVSGIRLRIPLMFVTREEYNELVQKGLYHPFQKRSYHSETGQRILLYPNGKVYMSCDLTGTEFNFALFKDGVFVPTEGINELTIFEKQPKNADPSAVLLKLEQEGLVRLSISYKEVIKL